MKHTCLWWVLVWVVCPVVAGQTEDTKTTCAEINNRNDLEECADDISIAADEAASKISYIIIPV